MDQPSSYFLPKPTTLSHYLFGLVLLSIGMPTLASESQDSAINTCQRMLSQAAKANTEGSFSDSISVECGSFDGEYWGPDGTGEACVNIKVSNTGECRVDMTYPNGSSGFSIPPGRSRARQTKLRSGQFVGYHCAVGDGNCRFTISISGCVSAATAEPLANLISRQ